MILSYKFKNPLSMLVVAQLTWLKLQIIKEHLSLSVFTWYALQKYIF